ncbi:MAG: uracil-DNA glycosylase family protein, partial [Flavobacteriales bacterium]|nr:uracil-DNA glycosylase family protein [Flavobacteriales bacterium]
LWHAKLFAAMKNVTLIVLIGQHAHEHYLGDRAKPSLTETVKHFNDYLPTYFPLVHPSPRNNIWQAKNPWFRERVLPELRQCIKGVLTS